MENHRLNKVYNGHKLYKCVDPSVDWKLLQTPDGGQYSNAGGLGGSDQMRYANWPSTLPTWLIGVRFTEIRGNVNAVKENKASGSLARPNTDGVTCFDVPYDLEYNKYLLFDLYGWYYCEGRTVSLVHFSDGYMTMTLYRKGQSTLGYPKIFDVKLTPSNIVTTVAEFPQNNKNKVTYKNNNTDSFVQDNGFNQLINFRCLVDLTTKKVFNKAKYVSSIYAPFDDIETDVWNYVGDITDEVYNLIINGNCTMWHECRGGAFCTGITNWYQSGLMWSNFTFNGCKRSNLNIHYV